MGLQEAIADIRVVRDQLAKSAPDGDVKKLAPWQQFMLDNMLPLIEGIAGGAQADLDEVDEVVEDMGNALDELIDNTGEMLLPATTTKILGVLQCGKLVADELEKLLKAGASDDLSKRKCRELIGMYRQGVELVAAELSEITTPAEDEDPANNAAQPDQGGEPHDQDEDDEKENA